MKRVFVRSRIGNNYLSEGPYVTAAVTVGERGKVGPSARSAADNGDDSPAPPPGRVYFHLYKRVCTMHVHVYTHVRTGAYMCTRANECVSPPISIVLVYVENGMKSVRY